MPIPEKLPKEFSGLDMALIENYYNSIDAVTEAVKKYTKPSENHGLPTAMKPEDYDYINQVYLNAMSAVSAISEKLKEKSPKSLIAHETVLNTEYLSIKQICKKKEAIPLTLALKKTRNCYLEGSLVNGLTVGDVNSSRHVISIVDKNGKTRTGLFTKAKSFGKKELESAKQNDTFNEKVILKTSPGDRIDTRNAAMSDVAGLLGRDDLLAHSQMIDFTENGVRREGTFMEFVNGTDLSKAEKGDPYYDTEKDDFLTSSAKKDLLDLSIIDYICLNSDRHQHNMIYQYQKCDDGKTRLAGIKGIDNDSSFGTKNPNPSEPFIHLQSLDATVCMTESMAKKINAMTDAALTQTLKKNKLSSASINAAIERLHNIKAKMELSKEFNKKLAEAKDFDSTPREQKFFLMSPDLGARKLLKTGKGMGIAIIPDRFINEINMKSLATLGDLTPLQIKQNYKKGKTGVINKVVMVHGTDEAKRETRMIAREKARIKRMVGDVDEGKAPSQAVQKEDTVATYCAKLNKPIQAMYETLKSETGFFKAKDPTYTNIMNALEEMSTLSANISKKENPTDMEMNVMRGYCKKLQIQCKSYIENNLEAYNAGTIKGYKLNRLMAVKNAMDNTKEYEPNLRTIQERQELEFNLKMASEADKIAAKGMQM